jgi:hypothetical protein
VERKENGHVTDEHEHDLNALAAHLEGRLEGEERRRTIDHLSTCLQCRETAAMLSRSQPALAEKSGDPSVPDERVTTARPWWLGLAAAAVVGTAVAVRVLSTASPDAGPKMSPSSFPPGGPASVAKAADPPTPPPADGARLPSPSARVSGPVLDEGLLARRGGVKRVAGKAFRPVGGEWIDMSYEPTAGLPEVDIGGPDERGRILSRLPALAPYFALGDRVVVVFEGTVYHLRTGGAP